MHKTQRTNKRKTRTDDPYVSIPETCTQCVICKEIMHDPTTVDCPCKRSFCHECVDAWLKKQNRCPHCNEVLEDTSKTSRGPAEWNEALDNIKRSCPNYPKCRFRRGTYQETKNHLKNECLYRKVSCPNEACGEVLEHKKLKEHLRLCLLKRCKHFRPPRFGCTMLGTLDFIRQHEVKCCFGEPEVIKQIEELTARYKK